MIIANRNRWPAGSVLEPDAARTWRAVVLASALAASGLLCWSMMLQGSKLTLAIAIVPLILPFIVAYAAMRERGLMDPSALFAAFFGFYNGVLIIRFLSEEVRDHLPYPIKFDPEVFFRAGLLSALGAVFIAITWAAWKKPPAQKNFTNSDVSGWFNVGAIFFAMGILMYLLQYLQMGGYWSAMATQRGRRFEVMTQALSLPYLGFVLVGLVMMIIAARGRKQRALAIGMTALWCLMLLPQGDRRLLLQAIMAVCSAAMFIGRKSVPVRMKHILVAVMAYLVFAIFGYLREQIPLLLSDAPPQYLVVESNEKNPLLESAKPENSELAGPYFSVLYNAEQVRDYSLGASYVNTILTILPRVIYASKPLAPAQDLANTVHRGGTQFAVAGWGYSPIAEAYLNFGVLGVCLMSAVWMSAFTVLSRLRNHRWGLVSAAVLSSETINVNRIDFRTVYLESFYCMVVVVLAALIVVLYQRTSRVVSFEQHSSGSMKPIPSLGHTGLQPFAH